MFQYITMNIIKNKYTIALTLITSIGLSACSDKQQKEEIAQTEKQESAIDTPSVAVVPINRGTLNSTITVPGELVPFQEVDLYAKITSYVKKLYADIGSQVHTGELLATLEAPELNSQLAAAESHIKQQEAVYYASKATYDRLLNTSKTPGTVSENDLEQAEAKKNSDLANVEAARSDYKAVAANLNYLQIRAPFDGIVSARNVNLGAYVGGSNQPIFVIQQQSKMRLVISVPELYTGGLSGKDMVTFSVKALPNRKFKAQVKRLAGALDEKLRAERLEMDVYNKNKELLPGMYADVDLPIPSRDSAFIVPKTAVVVSTERVFVIRVNGNKAEWVDVKKGFQSGGNMEIYGDLRPGDKLVAKANDEIRDGQQVRIGNSGSQVSGAVDAPADTTKKGKK
ncbi:MAG TPA: efflux RND transporter periplasmic adaptor subunit [Mucilaginibacter sp.]|jgi:RND family efflux transporter MFP subunit|nr:efflux RND transporter periplasmic adaptor subunit [Mucilaginibacter sp.]